jgi:hypothetical protein
VYVNVENPTASALEANFVPSPRPSDRGGNVWGRQANL